MLAVQDALARGGRGGGGGFRRGGGGGRMGAGAYAGGGFPRGGYSGGVSRTGPARNGSIRSDRYPSQTNPNSRSGSYGDVRNPERSGGLPTGVTEGPRGGTIDRDVTREGDTVYRDVTVTGPNGETASYEGVSKRTDDGIVSRGHLETSGGVDAQTGSRIEKTDGGFIAHGGAVGEDGAARGTIHRDGDTVTRRGVATDGKDIIAGGTRCKDGECRGARVYADRKTYKYNDYYYYPYYHYWYSCPMGATSYRSRYGAPVYGCSNTIVISTTVYLDQPQSSNPVKSLASDSRPATPGATTAPAGATPPEKARVRSGAAMVYEAAEGVSVYSTSWKPDDVYSEPHEGQYYWVGGEPEATPQLKEWIATAVESSKTPDANASVISYEVSDRTVYLTSEPAAPGVFTKQEDGLYAWIPGVTDPSDEDEAAIATALRTQAGAGGEALEKEVRQLEEGREDPPAVSDSGSPAG